MQMSEIKAALPNCPRCGRHCPIDQTNCPRGQELAEKLLNDEMTLEEALGASGSHSHGDHGARGDHEHGRGHDHPHGHHHHHEHEEAE